MKDILMVDDEEAIRDLLQLLIESEFDNNLLVCDSGNSAIETLKEINDIGLVLSDYSMPNGTGGDLYNYIKDETKLAMILITGGYLDDYTDMPDFLETNSANRVIQKPFNEEDLYSSIRNGLTDIEVSSDSSENYKRVDIDLLLRYMGDEVFNCFVKLAKKFIKVVSKENDFSSEDVLKYKKKGEKYIYLEEIDFKLFKKSVIKSIFSQIDSAQNLSESIDASAEALDYVSAGAKTLRIDQEQIELIDRSVQKCLERLSGDEEVTSQLKAFLKGKGYKVSHSMTSLHLSYMLAKMMNLDTDATIETLAFTSMFHDLYIADFLSPILDHSSNEFENLEKFEQDAVLGHTVDASNEVKEMKDIPKQVEKIIREHHELSDGSGFPEGLDANSISPLSAIYIVSLHTSDYLFYNDNNDQKELLEFFNKFKQGHYKGSFIAPIDALEKILNLG